MLHRINDYRYIRRHPEEVACVVGKAHLLDTFDWHNPIVFGSSVFAHPLADPDLLTRKPVKRILVPGEWMPRMFEPYYESAVVAWPVGIDTDLWKPHEHRSGVLDFLIYNKIHWDYERQSSAILEPIRRVLASRNLTFVEIQYGRYEETEYQRLLQCVRGMITLGEHETQGIAYLQGLSSGVPILAWDRGGYWQDPEYYPHRVQFGPVTSVPYWDERCGERFRDAEAFPARLDEFLTKLGEQVYKPREYILENLTLEQCARHYLRIIDDVRQGIES